ncbi:hypothetical protein GW750_03745 [bacterium]|nr:hypothetical protein [bacterium]
MSIDDATQTTMNNIDAYQQKVLSVTNDSMSDEQKIMAVAVLVTQDYARNNNV